MKISLHTKIGEKEETISFDFQSDSKTDCAIVEKYTTAFNGYIVVESVTDGMDDKELLEKLRNCKIAVMAQ